MGKIRFEESRLGRFFSGKGFYMVLAACLIAVGAAAWTAISSLSPPPVETGELESSSLPSDGSGLVTSGEPSGGLADVDQLMSDIADNRSQPADSQSSPSSEAPSASDPSSQAAAPVADFFVLPVTGDIIKVYSDTELQYSETYKDMRLHTGVDIAAEQGAKVKASGDGTVTDVYEDPLWGSTVVIDHGKGVTIYYCGLNKQPTVQKGDIVTPGTQLGDIGEIPCEAADQAHLHLAIKQNDKWVSPLAFMGMEETDE